MSEAASSESSKRRSMRRKLVWIAVSWALACLLVLAPNDAWAAEDSNKIAARALGNDGVQAYQAGDYARATKQLEAAYVVLRVPSLGLWSARALAKVGKLAEASERYLEASRLPIDAGSAEDVQRKAIEEAVLERQELLDRIPMLTIRVSGVAPDGVHCTVDGVAVESAALGKERAANPGAREVVCKHDEQEQKRAVTLQEGARETVQFAFTPAPRPSAQAGAAEPRDRGPAGRGRMQRVLGWSAIGVGAAGLVVGGVLGILAAEKQAGFDCVGTVCNEPQTELDAYNQLRVPSTVALVAGGVLAATGVTLLLTAPKAQAHARSGSSVTAYLTTTGVGLRGRF